MEALATPAMENTYTGANRWIVRLLPSLTDLAFILPALWLFIRMEGSASLLCHRHTGWHLRTGEWIWKHRAVPTTDIFSFTRPHDAWFAWEWLWDLLFAAIHRAGGLGAVTLVNVCLLGLISVMLFRLIRRTTDNDFLSIALTTLAMAGSTIHWLARPHLFTWVFLLIFAHILLSVRRGRSYLLLWLPACMIFWTNLHGGFFLGIFMLLLAAAGEAANAFLHAQDLVDALWYRCRGYLGCALACSLATLINPYGWKLHAHIGSYVMNSDLLSRISEFQSISFRNPAAIFFEGMLFLAVPAALWSVLRKQYGSALSICFWAHLALLSARNIPLFHFLCAPAAAAMLQDVLGRAAQARRFQAVAAKLTAFTLRIKPLERAGRVHAFSGFAVLVLAIGFAAESPGFEPKLNKKFFPTSALAFIKTSRITRLFTTDQWADYFVYNLYPDQRSFVDGRSDFFGNKLMDKYGFVLSARWDWEKILNDYSVDGVALRPDVPVVAALKSSPHWNQLFDDGSVIVFQHVFQNVAVRRSLLANAPTVQVSSAEWSGRKVLGINPGLIVKPN